LLLAIPALLEMWAEEGRAERLPALQFRQAMHELPLLTALSPQLKTVLLAEVAAGLIIPG